jgi:hypothetical protein
MRISKIAVDRVVRRLDQKIGEAMERWEKKHPAPAKELTNADLLAEAFDDPQWRERLIARVTTHGQYGAVGEDCLAEDSVRVRKQKARVASMRAPWTKCYNARHMELDRKRDRLLDEIIIDGKDLMGKVEHFGED